MNGCGRRVKASLAVRWWLAGLMLAAGTAYGQDEEAEDVLLPGLAATYRVAGQVVCSRPESSPTVRLGGEFSPDPRVPLDGWNAEWTGVLQVIPKGTYRFFVQATGPVEILLDNRPLRLMPAGEPDRFDSGPVPLKFGFLPLVVKFSPRAGEKVLRLEWQGEKFGREPLTSRVVGRLGQPGTELPPDAFAAGQLLLEEHSCAACHQPKGNFAGVEKRPGPHLSAGKPTAFAGWIYRWLDDPHAFRPEAVMPQMFSRDRRGEIERYAVAVTLGLTEYSNPKEPEGKRLEELAKGGAKTFTAVGCAVCHEPGKDRLPTATLRHLNAKKPFTHLKAFLQNPHASDPAGRMPSFQLENNTAEQVTAYAITREPAPAKAYELPAAPRAEELQALLLGDAADAAAAAKFAETPVKTHLANLAKQVMTERRCANCHQVDLGPAGKLAPSWAKSDLPAVAAKGDGGCVAAAGKPRAPATPAAVPVYEKNLQTSSLAAYLSTKTAVASSQAPAHQAALHFERLRCTSCHERDNRGGLAGELLEKLTKGQTEQAAESVKPPTLTGIVAKLHGPALADILEQGKRARPWMSLKMPQFKPEHMKAIPVGLAAQDGDRLVKELPKRFKNTELAEAGRTLIGSKGFGCIKCHDMLSVSSGGTRGPDLARVGERINPDWYHRWMLDPQRIEPGTRMPTVFLEGKSPYPTILGGDIAKQREALWQYFSYCRSMPAPEGLQPENTIQQLAATGDEPLIARTFLPDVTARSLAIRFPNAVHAVFDAQSCRVAYAWSGEFLDMGPVWNGRGGQKAGIKGQVFWKAPGGFPWDVTAAGETAPDLSKRGTDTTFGAETPHDGKLHPSRVRFRGYRLATEEAAPSRPTFKYELDLDDAGTETAAFEEELKTISLPEGQGVRRVLEATAPAGKTVWFLAATSEQPPLAWGPQGTRTELAENAAAPATAVLEVVDQGKPLMLSMQDASAGCEWVVAKQDNRLHVYLRWKPAAGAAAGTLVVVRPDEGRPGSAEALRSPVGAK